MRNKLLILILTVILFLQINLFSEIFAITENESSKIINDLLKGEELNDFLSNQESNRFSTNFKDNEKLRMANNDIRIKPGAELILDGEQIPEFSTILIEGTLKIFSTDNGHPLKAQKIIITPTGKLIIGSQEQPINSGQMVELIFVKNQPGEIGIFVLGELKIHGHNVGPTFAQIIDTADIGKTKLTLNKSVREWEKDHEIVITSAGSSVDQQKCTEEAKILRTEGIFLYLEEPLKCLHVGKFENYDILNSHVALLTRNVLIQSEDPSNRGFVKLFYGSKVSIYYAEFRDLGQKNKPGGYPIHFHRMGDSSKGIEIIGNSIVNSENRWITIHDSNGVIVKNNVGYKSIGHGYFFEDGTEFNNVFENNIGIKTVPGDIIESDRRTSIFWIQNPFNSFKNNVAVEGFYYGFHFDIPHKLVKIPNSDNEINLRELINLEFEENQAYNNRHAGLRIDRKILDVQNTQFSKLEISKFHVMNSLNEEINHDGIRLNADGVIVTDPKIIDGQIGINISGDRNEIKNALILSHNYENLNHVISGIRIAGNNILIENSKIEGYV